MNYDKIRHMIHDLKENITGDVTSIDQIIDEIANQVNPKVSESKQKGLWKEEIEKVRQCQQRQDGLTDQLNDLIPVANKLGFYDAATFLKERNK